MHFSARYYSLLRGHSRPMQADERHSPTIRAAPLPNIDPIARNVALLNGNRSALDCGVGSTSLFIPLQSSDLPVRIGKDFRVILNVLLTRLRTCLRGARVIPDFPCPLAAEGSVENDLHVLEFLLEVAL